MKNSDYYICSDISHDAEIGTNFEIGDIVKHSIYGIGKVLTSAGNGGHQRVGIFFTDGTKKKLMVKYANLKKLWTDKWMYHIEDAGGREAPRGTIIGYVDYIDINVDDIIEHSTFGVGKVLTSAGNGEHQSVGVLFTDGTKRKLIVKYANLTKLF